MLKHFAQKAVNFSALGRRLGVPTIFALVSQARVQNFYALTK